MVYQRHNSNAPRLILYVDYEYVDCTHGGVLWELPGKWYENYNIPI